MVLMTVIERTRSDWDRRAREGADPLQRPISPREYLLAAACSAALIWINCYICREIFHTPAGSMPSMQGFWIALAERAQGSWWHPSWWPYWNCGMPFEAAYAPLIPALTAAWAALRHVPAAVAFNAITGVVYIALPLTMFWMAWILSRSPGYAFFAALLYSLTAPTQVILPDEPNSIQNFWQAWRLSLAVYWDETPHLAALAVLPLSILLLWLAMFRPRRVYSIAAAILIAIATYASAFAPIVILAVSICLIATAPPADRVRHAMRIAGIGILGYALAAASLPPSLIHGIAVSSPGHQDGELAVGSFTALALIVFGWCALWPAIRRIRTPYLRFFCLFAYLTSAIPMVGIWLNRSFLPQPKRYRMEMEMALALVIVFGLRPLLEKFPKYVRGAIAFVVLCVAAEQIISHRVFAKAILRPVDMASTIEYRAAVWTDRNLPGVRVMLPGSIAQWADHFAPIEQFSAGSWSQAANPVQQLGMRTIFKGGDTPEQDARVSVAWLEAFGVGAIAISGAESTEYWKPYAHPRKFDGVLPALWSESGVTIYRIPQRSASLAHVIPNGALVRRAPVLGRDIEAIERYDAALNDRSLPEATFEWVGRNRIRIAANPAAGQVVSVQVSYHPGWHAKSGGREIAVHQDGLGLMWLESAGPAEIVMDYDGGFELRLFRAITIAALIGLLAFSVWQVAIRIRSRRP
jgi:hypothetical protein